MESRWPVSALELIPQFYYVVTKSNKQTNEQRRQERDQRKYLSRKFNSRLSQFLYEPSKRTATFYLLVSEHWISIINFHLKLFELWKKVEIYTKMHSNNTHPLFAILRTENGKQWTKYGFIFHSLHFYIRINFL